MAESENDILFIDVLKKLNIDIDASQVILMYEGEVNHEIIKAMLYTLESYFFKVNYKRIFQKRVFNILVESIQNIEKHSIPLSPGATFYSKKGAILILDTVDDIVLFSCNTVTDLQKEFLIEKQHVIQGKSKLNLRDIYKQQLMDGTINEKGGAGLGFIDIARKSNNQIKFYFLDINADFSHYILQSNVKKM
jgi:hypothetical protein